RGKCKGCGKSISWRYPLVEMITGILFALVTYVFIIVNTETWFLLTNLLQLLGLLSFFATSLALALIDIDHYRLPTKIIIYGTLSTLLLYGSSSVILRDWSNLLFALVGGVAAYLFFLVIHLVVPNGMGKGDVNLAGLIGLVLGWVSVGTLLTGLFLGFLFGALFGIGLILAKKGNRKSAIPFGPWMILGSWVGLAFGDAIWFGYLSLNGIFT
ncbi:MAG: prepilin peptidase, partial [Actinomycetota bacterium]